MESITTVGRKNVSFSDKVLQNATMHIFKIGESLRRNWLEVAAVIAGVDAAECYKADGFTDVHDWVYRTFGIKKSTSYDLLRIGNEYVREVKSVTGKTTGYECNLLPEGVTDNFNTTQIRRMLPAGHDMAFELVSNGEITPDMSNTKIKDIIAAKMGKTPVNESTAPEDEPETDHEGAKENGESIIAKMLDKVTTNQLIKELNRRGYRVFNDSGDEVTPDA